jgi:hypothetical protein
MSLFTLGSARAVLVVALVYSFPDGQIVSVVTVNNFLSVVGKRFFNDYLRIDTKRFPISVK